MTTNNIFTKSIKITQENHKRLRILAAHNEYTISEMLDIILNNNLKKPKIDSDTTTSLNEITEKNVHYTDDELEFQRQKLIEGDV